MCFKLCACFRKIILLKSYMLKQQIFPIVEYTQ